MLQSENLLRVPTNFNCVKNHRSCASENCIFVDMIDNGVRYFSKETKCSDNQHFRSTQYNIPNTLTDNVKKTSSVLDLKPSVTNEEQQSNSNLENNTLENLFLAKRTCNNLKTLRRLRWRQQLNILMIIMFIFSIQNTSHALWIGK